VARLLVAVKGSGAPAASARDASSGTASRALDADLAAAAAAAAAAVAPKEAKQQKLKFVSLNVADRARANQPPERVLYSDEEDEEHQVREPLSKGQMQRHARHAVPRTVSSNSTLGVVRHVRRFPRRLRRRGLHSTPGAFISTALFPLSASPEPNSRGRAWDWAFHFALAKAERDETAFCAFH
jgi:hypothetical protein